MGFLNDENIAVYDGRSFELKHFQPDYTDQIPDEETALEWLERDKERLHDLQRKMFASDNHALLLVFQAMDAAGKDSTIRHVFSGMFPQGTQVFSFKTPSAKELDHDYLWRTALCLPERGRTSIFNRSHYEEVIVTRVHPEFILNQRIPDVTTLQDVNEDFWNERFKEIRDWEEHLVESGTIVLKFFLNVSKEEQKQRFIRRIEREDKNWKFSFGDIAERELWDHYQHAYHEAIRNTAQEDSPWFVIPADNKWFMRACVCNIIVERLEALDLEYPKVSKEDKIKMEEVRIKLLNEE